MADLEKFLEININNYFGKGVIKGGELMNENKKSNWLIYPLGILQAFIGLTGILGGFQLVSDPSGIRVNVSLEWLNGSPFPDYFVPGLILLIAIGVANTIGAAVTFFRSRYSGDAAVALAACLIIYLTVEIWVVGLRTPLQPSYFILAVIVLLLGLKLSKTFRRAPQLWVEPKLDELRA